MTRVLAFGHGPIPLENTKQGFAPGKRTWQLIKPLLDIGHDVCLVASRIPGVYPDSIPAMTIQRKEKLIYYSLSGAMFHRYDKLRSISDQFQPDCVLGITVLPASVAAELDQPYPLWADLYGSVMTEAQTKASVYHDDAYLPYFCALEYPVLAHADIFSAVSTRQSHALLGELGLYGRLNQWTIGSSLVHVIPAGGETTPFEHTKTVIRGQLACPDDFVVLYSGGYNTWTDVNTLFYGVEAAMAQHERIVFVSTGGAIAGHDEETYPRFERLIAESPYKDRFHLCGWVDWREVHNYYLESDVGINADKICYEALFGSRTRVLDWMRAGLPAITTTFSEVTETLVANGAGFSYEPLNPESLTAVLLDVANNPSQVELACQRSQQLLNERFTFEKTTQALQAWVENPTHADDYRQSIHPLVVLASEAQVATAKKDALTSSEYVGLYETIRPLWSRLIHRLYRSPLAFTVKPLRMLSAAIKKLRKPLYRVTYEAVQITHEASTSAAMSAAITLINGGRMIWCDPENSLNPVNLSYHWRRADNLMLHKEGIRTPLPHRIVPNGIVTVEVQVKTPEEPGDYILEFDLVHEGRGWFSEFGANTYRLPVKVR